MLFHTDDLCHADVDSDSNAVSGLKEILSLLKLKFILMLKIADGQVSGDDFRVAFFARLQSSRLM